MEKKLTKVQTDNQELQTSLLKLEMERAMVLIRVQNFPEEAEEKVKERIESWISSELGIDIEQIRDEVNKVYRIYSRFVR